MKLEITQAQRTINENQTTTSEHQTITNISSVLHLTQNKIICKYIPNADGPGICIVRIQRTSIVQTTQISCDLFQFSLLLYNSNNTTFKLNVLLLLL